MRNVRRLGSYVIRLATSAARVVILRQVCVRLRSLGRSNKYHTPCIIGVDVSSYIHHILTMATTIKKLTLTALLALRLFSVSADASAMEIPGGFRKRQAITATVNV